MRILDLERKSGLERATIRFYEKEGLITPARQENGYRTYSQTDCDTLLKIKLLRQLGMSLEKIKDLQQGRVAFAEALTEQIGKLEQQIQSLTRARAVCIELRDTGVTYKDLNAGYYLEMLAKPVANGTGWTPKVVPEFYEGAKAQRHSIRRFAARILDYMLMACILNFLIFVIFRFRSSSFGTTVIEYLISYGSWFLLIPIQAVGLHKLGTTPGKWAMGIHVESCDGGNLTMEQALAREWEVLRDGVGFGLPVWSCWRMYKSWKQYYEQGKLDWDFESEYICNNWHWKQIAAAMIMVCLCLSGSVLTAQDRLKPKYRGDLTVAQFAANYNYYYDLLHEDAQVYNHLDPEGKWKQVPEGMVVLRFGSTSENEDWSFQYESDENGYITTVSCQNTWSDIFMFEPLTQSKIAAMSILMAQDGTGIREMQELAKMLDSEMKNSEGKLFYQNFDVLWSVTTENCVNYDGCYYVFDENGASRLTLSFKIQIHK